MALTPGGAVLGIDGAHDTFDVSYVQRLSDAKKRANVMSLGSCQSGAPPPSTAEPTFTSSTAFF